MCVREMGGGGGGGGGGYLQRLYVGLYLGERVTNLPCCLHSILVIWHMA